MGSDGTVHVVASTSTTRADRARACVQLGYHAEIYGDYEELLIAKPKRGVVLVEDIAQRGGISWLLSRMDAHGFWLPVIATAPNAQTCRVVQAVRGGALDYLSLPVDDDRLGAALDAAMTQWQTGFGAHRKALEARAKLATLTAREIEVLDRLVAGSSNKLIARELEISPRTVEIHRANMMAKLGAHNAADAVRLRLEAAKTVGTLPALA